jgi:N-acetylglutamate synthase-like GNAT family acetyltransferase
MEIFSRICHFLRGPNPLHPAVWTDRLTPISFRRLRPDDLQQCIQLYALNEPGRFPKGFIQKYEKSLVEEGAYFLVAENDGQIIASGGMSYYIREDMAVLFFGLVHPMHHGKGIGTALLLTRLALLKPIRFNYQVFIFAVEKSIGFYQRFGFKEFQSWKDPNGDMRPSGRLLFSAGDIRRCRALLKKHGIVFPEDEGQIPLRTLDYYQRSQ